MPEDISQPENEKEFSNTPDAVIEKAWELFSAYSVSPEMLLKYSTPELVSMCFEDAIFFCNTAAILKNQGQGMMRESLIVAVETYRQLREEK